MPNSARQIHREDQSPSDTPSGRMTAEVVALFVAGFVGLLAWLALRQPWLRQHLVELVPHRYPIAFAFERQILAPRSVALASVVLWLLALLSLLREKIWRRALKPQRSIGFSTALFVAFQSLIAISVVMNLNSYFLRTFHRPPCRINATEIYMHWIPQAFPHSLQLRQRVSEQARIALYVEGGAFNRYLFSALVYPIRCYYGESLTSGADSAASAIAELRKRGVEYYLHYDPFSTTEPLQLRRISNQ